MSKVKKPRFSIVIPCYNEADFIAATLDSLRLQDTKEKYEIIVVDNNCTDETIKIARSYDATVIIEKRAGVCWARQAGTQAAKGEIIISTDADTVFSNTWLSVIDKRFRQNEQLIAVAGSCRYYNGPWWGKSYSYILFMSVYIYYLLTGHPYYITATNVAFRKSAWHSYDTTSMQGGDELDLLHKLRKVGNVEFVNSNPVYTSARRLKRGLIYNLLITFLFYYLGGYYINKLSRRVVIGTAPAFRESNSLKISRAPFLLGNNFVVCTVFLLIAIAIASTSSLQTGLFNISYGVANATKDALNDLI